MTRRVDLLEELRPGFAHGFATTYSFGVEFFEQYVLDRVDAFSNCGNLNILIDGKRYDELLNGSERSLPKKANTRYLLHPVRVPGAFHPKLMFFANATRGLLIVGSANLTRQGLTSNAELAFVHRYETGKNEKHRGLFLQAAAFLESLIRRWPGNDLGSNWDDMKTEATWLRRKLEEDPGLIRLLHNLDVPLWDQLTTDIDAAVEDFVAVSPFFDETPMLLDQVDASLAPASIEILTENDLTTMTPAWPGHALVTEGRARLSFATWFDEGHRQRLHAKAVALKCNGSWRFAAGSANFTRNGWLSTASNGNVELILCLDIQQRSFNPRKYLDPDGTARQEGLRPGQRESSVQQLRPDVVLDDAVLFEKHVRGRCHHTRDELDRRWILALLFADGATARVPASVGSDSFSAAIADTITQRCTEATIVWLEGARADKPSVVSNRTLLLNLQDFDTGQNRSRARRVRDAERSAAGFAAALEDMRSAGDKEAMLDFLSFCNIRMAHGPRIAATLTPRVPGPRTGELGEPRARLRRFTALHEAAMAFCDRHLARLSRHLKRPSLDALANFIHIASAIGEVLAAQTDELSGALEQLAEPLDPDEWSSIREHTTRYLRAFGDMAALLGAYVAELHGLYEREQVDLGLAPDQDALRAIFQRIRLVRDRIEKCRGATFRVRTTYGTLVVPPILPSDTLSASQWTRWSQKVETAVATVLPP
jgi:hypothetical protein